ncbi:MAG: signal peptide peptidase SppA [Gemmatimonadota bacterium]
MSRRSVVTVVVVAVISFMTLTGIVLAVQMTVGGGLDLGIGGRIALIEVEGVIADDGAFLESVRRLRDDPSVRGWVVAVNSPGGVVAPAQSIYQTLRRIRAEDEVPVIASIGSVGASGGYYVALGADSILALPGSITGSIGVIMQYPNVRELMDKVGVEMELVTGGAQKDLGSPFREMSPEDREILNALVEDVHTQFIEAVVDARGMSVEEVRPLADGRVLSGRQAHVAGLVDRMGNVEEALRLAGEMAGLGPEPRIVRPPKERLPWVMELLLGESTARAVRQLARTMTAPVTRVGPMLEYIVR